jgi:molybdopterin-guanine dinucleotide biosynthesis protein A
MPPRVTLGILAGGRGARLGGADKAALRYSGEPLLARMLAAFADAADDAILLSQRADARAIAGEHAPPSTLAPRCVHDLRPGQPGPLAGLEALLAATRTPWLLTTPVDLRDVPAGLAARLRAAAEGDGDAAAATVVRDADGLQPLVALWPVATTLAAVRAALDADQRSARALVAGIPHRVLDVSPARLGNLNTPEDFAR